MKTIPTLFLLFILFSSVIKAKTLDFKTHTNVLNNANTLLLSIVLKEDIKDIKLSLDSLHLNFFKNPFKNNSYYALLP